MIKTFDYSENMMAEAVKKTKECWGGIDYKLVKDPYDAYFEGYSPKETRIRLEPFCLFLQECPTKARLYWNEEKDCWTFYRDTNA